jgi:hypothetical protein
LGIALLAILNVTKLVLYVGLAMVLVGAGWSAKGFGKSRRCSPRFTAT